MSEKIIKCFGCKKPFSKFIPFENSYIYADINNNRHFNAYIDSKGKDYVGNTSDIDTSIETFNELIYKKNFIPMNKSELEKMIGKNHFDDKTIFLYQTSPLKKFAHYLKYFLCCC